MRIFICVVLSLRRYGAFKAADNMQKNLDFNPEIDPENSHLWDRLNGNRNITNNIPLSSFISSDSTLEIC